MINLTPLLRLYARFRLQQLARQDPVAAQQGELLKLICSAYATKFGREHAFGELRSVEDYQKRVPIRSYEDFWENYWKPAFPRLKNCTWPGLIPFLPGQFRNEFRNNKVHSL
jgi:hypothetical protein